MHNFKKAFIASLSFLLCFVLLFSIVVYPAFSKDSLYNDSGKRAELAGSTELLICGASHALGGFIPDIIDEELGIKSYNLSSYAASFEGKRWLIEKELERNSVETFVLEISHDTIRDYSNDRSTGEPMTVMKLDSFGEMLRYSAKNISFTDLDKVGSVMLRYGLNAWKARLSGQLNIPQQNRGYIPNNTLNLGTNAGLIADLYHSNHINTDFDNDSLMHIEAIAGLCEEKGCRFVIAVVPVADQLMISFDNVDEFVAKLGNFCAERGYEFYDFNMLKNRTELFDDSDCYFDSSHLGPKGAEAFSHVFAQVMMAAEKGEDTSRFFADSFEELEEQILAKYN